MLPLQSQISEEVSDPQTNLLVQTQQRTIDASSRQTGESDNSEGTFLEMWPVLVFVLVVLVASVIITVLRQRLQQMTLMIEGHRRERSSVLQFLHRMGEMITNESDLETTLEVITEFLIEETGALAGAIYLVNDEEDEAHLEARAVRGYYPPMRPVTGYALTKQKHLHRLAKAERIPWGEGVVGQCWETGEGVLIAEALHDSRIPAEAHELVKINTMMLMPLRIRDQVVGVFAVINKRQEGEAFTAEEMNLLETLADQAAVTVKIVQLYDEMTEKKRVESELQIASDFQRMMLPAAPPEVEGFEIATHCSPALEMGGDYYDFIRVDDHHLGMVIADVSGKGVPGSLIMAMVRSAVRAEAPGELSPAKVLETINRRVYHDTRSNVFITMTYAILNERTRTLRFARAGHEPTICCDMDSGRPVLHTPEGIALGLVEDEPFGIIEEKTLDLSQTSLVVLYTDGVLEAMNDQGEEYGQDRFLDILQQGADSSAAALVESLLDDIGRFTGGMAPHDDITLIALRRRAPVTSESGLTVGRQTG